MAILKAGNYDDFKIETGDEAFDTEFADMLKVSKTELIAAVIGEQFTDKIWARIQRIRSQKHETMLKRLQAETGTTG